YAWRDLVHNPRRTLASMIGVALGVGLFSGVLFFVDGSAATMTARAIAPLALDIQRIVTAEPGSLRLTERITGPSPLEPGQQASIELVVTNEGVAPANDVVVHDEPPAPLTHVGGSTTRDGAPIPDIDGDNPLSHGVAGFGLNIGRLLPGGSVTIAYAAESTEPVADVASLEPRATVSSRELPVPIEANAAQILTLEELLAKAAAIPGVQAADGLAVVDLPAGALAAGSQRIRDPARVFAFDQRYLDHYPSISVVSGRLDPAGALLSVEAARSLGTEPGDEIAMQIPGRDAPLHLPVTGVVDLARAQPLFSSRKAAKLEEFLYVPNSVVISPETFRDVIIPAFGLERATVGAVTRSFPTLEVDLLVDRARLRADPSSALQQTKAIAQELDQLAPGQGYVIDNISNTLAVASDDASAGRRMFLFLGLPGALLAAFLAAYAGSVLAATERREHATLRVRGAHRGHLRTIALAKATVIACVGSLAGVLLGLVSATVILGAEAMSAASIGALATSALLATGVGLAITAIALYIPARRSVRREVSEERREMRAATVPAWRRYGLDVVLLVVAVAIEIVAIRRGALDPPVGSVYAGLAISLPTGLLPAPLIVWVGGLLLCVRALLGIVSHAPAPSNRRFGNIVPGISSRGLRRRAGDLAGGIIGLGLVVAFGVSLALFAATYDATKAEDARFSVGSDLRITPSVVRADRPDASYGSDLTVPGVSAVTPVVFDLENAVLIGPHNQKRKNLAAVDPEGIAAVAPLPDQVFVDATAADSIAALGADPRGVLVDEETADDLSVDVGDPVDIILALGTKRETQARFRVAGLFERFPGTAAGANLVIDLDRYREETGIAPVDFFLASADDRSPAGLARAVSALSAGPGAVDPIHIDTTETALDKDQSSLTAVNVNGLVRLNAFYVLLMSATAIAIFVFGLMLQRRGEYVALRAQGLRSGELRALVLLEAAVVTICGLAAGLAVGVLTAFLSIRILRGLFVLDPRMTAAPGRLATLATLVIAAAIVSGLAATEILRRLEPAEILREE
ncbi:MAG TPA: FtsX-like permease family protein, partial [Actinomycetota bacterium]|nr:FtsX-like permease family protein [Actinomycetota bacterium]